MASLPLEGTNCLPQPVESANEVDAQKRDAASSYRPKVQAKNKDIICGRGYHIVNHSGNLNLHLLVNKHREEYLKSKRSDKRKITMHILEMIKST